MTDPHDLDDLASAHLDGATTADEAARIAADPELQARVQALRAVRDALREPVATDPARRDAAIAAALNAFDEDGDARKAPDRTVVPLSPRRGFSPTTVRVLGAAAVIALLALLIPVLASSTGDDDEASFQSTGDAIAGAADGAGAGGGESSPEASTTTAADAAVRQLGSYASVDELVSAIETGNLLAEEAPADSGTDAQDTAGLTDCAPDEAEAAVDAARAVAGGRAVVVLVTREGDDVRLVVLDATTCEVLAERVR